MSPSSRWSTALLTGATHGIGAATARHLAPGVDRLLLHGPEPESAAQERLGELRAANAATEIDYVQADYDRLEDVAGLVADVQGRVGRLDLLINNAGRPGPPARELSADGHELTFQTNYLALVALTTGLMATIEAAGEARIINVASATHYSATLQLDDLELARYGYSAAGAYAHSKLAIVTYTCWLARQLQDTGVEAASIHPGVIATDLLHAMFSVGGNTTEHGARNIMHLVGLPSGVNGKYFDERQAAAPNPEALDHSSQERLVAATTDALRAAGLR